MLIPADVPTHAHHEFCSNYFALTKGTDRLFLFAADHKIEHLDTDFYGPHIDPEAHHPTHLFSIAQHAWIGAFATQLGLAARYGKNHPSIQYIIKLNSKTNTVPLHLQDPMSNQLWSVDDVIAFKRSSGFSIRGIGLTIYLGSTYEGAMLAQAAQAIYQAHQHGLITLLWIYPRGKALAATSEESLLPGAAGIATALGADFVKIHPPHPGKGESPETLLPLIHQAAGNTKVIYAGGAASESHQLLHTIEMQLSLGSSGVAIGRNIYQHSLHDALRLSQDISRLVYE
ncbi:aldolase [Candidatus Dependentiae bacterium]|nr:aldolase [Candidatus Dependentiae bacterium]